MDIVKKNLVIISKPLGHPIVRGFLVLLGLAHAACIAHKIPPQIADIMTHPIVCFAVMYAVVYAHTGSIMGSLGATSVFVVGMHILNNLNENFDWENPNIVPACRGITWDDILNKVFNGDKEAMRLAVLNHSNTSNESAPEVAIQLVNAGYDFSALGCDINELYNMKPNLPADSRSD